MHKRIVITGVTGLLGASLAKFYSAKTKNLVGLKRIGTPMPAFDFPIEILEGDIADTLFLEDSFINADLVIHTAALVSFDRRDKKEMFQTNVIGTKSVVDTCLLVKVPKLIFISSVASLGRNSNNIVIDENTQWENSDLNTNYAYSKYLAEQEFWRGIEEGLKGFCVNPSIILGCGDLNNTSNKIFQNLFKKIVPYIDGSINVVDLRDVVFLVTQLDEKEVNGHRYILNSTSIKVKTLLSYFTTITGAKLYKAPKLIMWCAWFIEGLISFFSHRKSQLTRETFKVMSAKSIYNSQKIQNTLSYSFIPIEDTMQHCIAYYVEKYK